VVWDLQWSILNKKQRNFLLAIFTSHMPKITKKGAKSDTYQDTIKKPLNLPTVVVGLYRVRYPDFKVCPILRPNRILATDNGSLPLRLWGSSRGGRWQAAKKIGTPATTASGWAIAAHSFHSLIVAAIMNVLRQSSELDRASQTKALSPPLETIRTGSHPEPEQ
jgi:hypothetical protein